MRNYSTEIHLHITFKIRYIPIHLIVKRIGIKRAKALPFFHAITGCDSLSSFFGIGKLTAWKIWDAMGDELTDAFLNIQSEDMENIETSPYYQVLQKFVIMLYDYKTYDDTTHGSVG